MRASPCLISPLSGFNKFTSADADAVRNDRASFCASGRRLAVSRQKSYSNLGWIEASARRRWSVFFLLAGMRPGPGTFMPYFLSVCCHFIVDMEITIINNYNFLQLWLKEEKNKEFTSEQRFCKHTGMGICAVVK